MQFLEFLPIWNVGAFFWGGRGGGWGFKGEIYLIFTERQWNLTLFYFIFLSHDKFLERPEMPRFDEIFRVTADTGNPTRINTEVV